MTHHQVRSSNLHSVGYDPERGVLEIVFRDGSLYAYSGVPQGVWRGLMAAGSKGSYHHAHIRGLYSFVRLS